MVLSIFTRDTNPWMMSFLWDNIAVYVVVYRRCRIRSLVYHSLLYKRRQMSNYFFIQYQDTRSSQHFGEISYFFRWRSTLWIQRSLQRRVSNIWVSRLAQGTSGYFFLCCKQCISRANVCSAIPDWKPLCRFAVYAWSYCYSDLQIWRAWLIDNVLSGTCSIIFFQAFFIYVDSGASSSLRTRGDHQPTYRYSGFLPEERNAFFSIKWLCLPSSVDRKYSFHWSGINTNSRDAFTVALLASRIDVRVFQSFLPYTSWCDRSENRWGVVVPLVVSRTNRMTTREKKAKDIQCAYLGNLTCSREMMIVCKTQLLWRDFDRTFRFLLTCPA